jgi:ABC-type branched-subunit amino acid transport system substrate-binding protein
MRRTGARRFVFGALALALGLVLASCSIQAPDITLSGGSGGGGGTLSGGGGGGTLGGGGGTTLTGGGGGGSTGGGGGGGASESCLGRATDTGVTASEIKLGSTFALSGPVSNISAPIYNGVQAYFNEVNRAGGIFGRRINLIAKDDGWDAQKGRALIKQLVEQEKVFVLSVVPSSNGLDAAKTYLEQRRMPVYGTSGLIESQFRSPMQWPVGTGTRSAARIALIDAKMRGVRNAAIIWLDLLAGKEARDAFFAAIPSVMGVKPEDFITAERQVSLSEASFGPVWASIKSQTEDWQRRHGQQPTGIPDFVFLAIDPTNGDKALKAAQDINFRPRVGWGGGAPLFLSVLAQNEWARRTGLMAQTSYFPPLPEYASNAAVQAYRRTLEKYYSTNVDPLNPYLEGGYAGAALVVEILRRSGPCLTRERTIQVANGLTNFSAAGLTQPLSYSAQSHYGNTWGLILQVTPNGTWRVARDWLRDPAPGT